MPVNVNAPAGQWNYRITVAVGGKGQSQVISIPNGGSSVLIPINAPEIPGVYTVDATLEASDGAGGWRPLSVQQHISAIEVQALGGPTVPLFDIGDWVHSNIPIAAPNPAVVSKREWIPEAGMTAAHWQYEIQYWWSTKEQPMTAGIAKQFAVTAATPACPRIIARNSGTAMQNTSVRIGDYIGFGNGGRGIAIEDTSAINFQAAVWYNRESYPRHEAGLSMGSPHPWVERVVCDPA